jgi:hypothetical protein
MTGRKWSGFINEFRSQDLNFDGFSSLMENSCGKEEEKKGEFHLVGVLGI